MEKKLRFLFIVLATFTLMGCRSRKIVQEKANFQGVVLEQNSNSMPMVDRVNANGSPLATKLFIYNSTSISQLDSLIGPFCSRINSELVSTIQSDEKGRFASKLKPGIYSVFVRYENAYYIPYFSGSTGTALFEVKKDTPTQLEVIVRGSSNIQ